MPGKWREPNAGLFRRNPALRGPCRDVVAVVRETCSRAAIGADRAAASLRHYGHAAGRFALARADLGGVSFAMNSPKTALLHLTGDRPMPNLLGVLAVRPALCVQVVPADAHPRANALAGALAPVLPGVTFESVEVAGPRGGAAPSGAELRRCVGAEIAGLREAGYEPVVNVAGDGSPAALAVLAGALDAKARIAYVDTNAGAGAPLLVDPVGGDSGAIPAEWSDARRVSDALSVGLVAAAHGAVLSPGARDPEVFLDCALRMAAFGPKEWAELREALPDVDAVKLPEKLLELADKPVHLPTFARGLEDAGLACGVFVKSGSGALHLALPHAGREALWALARERAAFVKFGAEEWKFRLEAGVSGFRFNRDFLAAGGWFEILVWEHLRRSDRFRDVVLNPVVSTPRGPEIREGIFAIEGLGLAAFSCRPGGAIGGLPTVAGDLARLAGRIGGAGAAKYLALALRPQNLNEVIAQSDAHGVKVIGDSRAFRTGSERDPFVGFKVTA